MCSAHCNGICVSLALIFSPRARVPLPPSLYICGVLLCNAVSLRSSPVPYTWYSNKSMCPVSSSLLRGCRVPERHTLLPVALNPNSPAERLTSFSFLSHASLSCSKLPGALLSAAFRSPHTGPASPHHPCIRLAVSPLLPQRCLSSHPSPH